MLEKVNFCEAAANPVRADGKGEFWVQQGLMERGLLGQKRVVPTGHPTLLAALIVLVFCVHVILFNRRLCRIKDVLVLLLPLSKMKQLCATFFFIVLGSYIYSNRDFSRAYNSLLVVKKPASPELS